jgi:hypothetical protein
MLDPAGRRSRHETPSRVVPLSWTIKLVFKAYEKAELECGATPVSQKQFRRVWVKHTPWLLLMAKRTDFCNTCYALKLSGDVQMLEVHIQLANDSRAYKKANIQRAADSISLDGKRGIVIHISFDYAQNVQLPSFADQARGVCSWFVTSTLGFCSPVSSTSSAD